MKKGLEFLTTDWILGQFAVNKKKAERLYGLFIKEGIMKGSPWKKLKGQIYLGRVEFMDKFKEILKRVDRVKEIPRFQR